MTQDEEYKAIHDDVLRLIERDWGKRCETKDTEDFPELLNSKNGRCGVCVVYEKFDKFWARLEG